MTPFLRKVYWLIRRRQKQAELDEELEFHLAEEAAERAAAGLADGEARRAARKQFGRISIVREDTRASWTSIYLEQLAQDLRYGTRMLWRNKASSALAIVSLALGIGANTAVFSVVNGVLFKGLPYRDPQQLVWLSERPMNGPDEFGFSPPDFDAVSGLARSFSDTAMFRTTGYELAGAVTPQRVTGARVSPQLFATLGVRPILGRTWTNEDDRQNARVAILSHTLWSAAFENDPSAIGRVISVDGRPYVIVGVMPEHFAFPPHTARLNGDPADLFVPLSLSPAERQALGYLYAFGVIGRLRTGASIQQARAELTSLVPAVVDRYPAPLRPTGAELAIQASPLYEASVGSARPLLLVMMGAVALVLLITCANVAGLLLTQSASREHELAIRTALGASALRISRQLLTEAFVLSVAGSVAGLMLAYWFMRGLLSVAGDRLPRVESIAFDTRVLAFTMTLAVVSPLIFGVMPAFRAVTGVRRNRLKHEQPSFNSGRSRRGMLGSVVIGQIAIALILSVAAGLLSRSLVRLLRTDPGFRSEHAVAASVSLPTGRYPFGQLKDFYGRAAEAIGALPGIDAVGVADDLPLGLRDRRSLSADPTGQRVPDSNNLVAFTWTAGAYFEAVGIPLKRGRFFTDQDGPTSPRVAVVNERLAQVLWPDANPLGHQIRSGINVPQNRSEWMTIVGVVGDVKPGRLDEPAIGEVYVPAVQEDLLAGAYLRTAHLVIRSPRDLDSIASEIRGAIHRLDASLPVTVQTLDDMIQRSVEAERLSMTAMMLFAVFALMLGAIGVYGVLANVVMDRTREIGIRIALGATAAHVLWVVARRMLTLLGIGLVLGAAGAAAATRVLAAQLFEIHPTDAWSYIGGVGALAIVSLLASAMPAWRATRVDPVVALRYE